MAYLGTDSAGTLTFSQGDTLHRALSRANVRAGAEIPHELLALQ